MNTTSVMGFRSFQRRILKNCNYTSPAKTSFLFRERKRVSKTMQQLLKEDQSYFFLVNLKVNVLLHDKTKKDYVNKVCIE